MHNQLHSTQLQNQ